MIDEKNIVWTSARDFALRFLRATSGRDLLLLGLEEFSVLGLSLLGGLGLHLPCFVLGLPLVRVFDVTAFSEF